MESKADEMDKFYGMFGKNITDTQDTFLDIFSEFIGCLNEVDLSDKTMNWLNDIFEKDAKMLFRKLGED